MNAGLLRELAIRPALRLLPPAMSSIEAEAMLLAIGLQESRLAHRRQIGGPARSYWQFEFTGCSGVLTHHASRDHAERLCQQLDVYPRAGVVHAALEYQDVLAAAFARLLLWTLPTSLPKREQADTAWQQYQSAWRPGKPHPQTWPELYALAWEVVSRTT
jgi:hypothetical protein